MIVEYRGYVINIACIDKTLAEQVILQLLSQHIEFENSSDDF